MTVSDFNFYTSDVNPHIICIDRKFNCLTCGFLFAIKLLWRSVTDKIFQTNKQKYFLLKDGRSLNKSHTSRKLNYDKETALQQSNSFTFTSNSPQISSKNPQTKRITLKKY